jgi:hypothetical protein
MVNAFIEISMRIMAVPRGRDRAEIAAWVVKNKKPPLNDQERLALIDLPRLS